MRAGEDRCKRHNKRTATGAIEFPDLDEGQDSLARLRTESAGGLHWVVFAAAHDGLFTVGD
jgi:hypothetical protein